MFFFVLVFGSGWIWWYQGKSWILGELGPFTTRKLWQWKTVNELFNMSSSTKNSTYIVHSPSWQVANNCLRRNRHWERRLWPFNTSEKIRVSRCCKTSEVMSKLYLEWPTEDGFWRSQNGHIIPTTNRYHSPKRVGVGRRFDNLPSLGL